MGVERRDGSVQGRRILVIADESLAGTVLHEAMRFRARNVGGEVLLVAPALGARRRRPTADADGARRAAEARLGLALDRLKAAAIHARGQLGDRDPMQAIADALDLFAADEIVIATHPEARSEWLAHDVVARARVRFDQPILHIVVDLARQAGSVPAAAVPRPGPPVTPSPPAPRPTLTAS